jgi:hypothetical protein
MSGESAHHIRLVEVLIQTVERDHRPRGGLMVFADHHRFGADRPPNIGGFQPDLFASDVPSTFRILGEAKTPYDLETDRSRRQLMAFFDHLALYPGSRLYLAVPFLTAPRARYILKSVRRPEHDGVTADVLACV